VIRKHEYQASVAWSAGDGPGTTGYQNYTRDHEISAPGRPPLPGSADPAFRGDGSRYNPEDLLIASLAACHMLWYLHLCAEAGIVVLAYRDEASGTMEDRGDQGGRFTEAVLRPRVTVRPGSDTDLALRLHERAHALCFVANSVNFPVHHEAQVGVGS
jgi:organic hydroperoxide reductase OsmC/OhrA